MSDTLSRRTGVRFTLVAVSAITISGGASACSRDRSVGVGHARSEPGEPSVEAASPARSPEDAAADPPRMPIGTIPVVPEDALDVYAARLRARDQDGTPVSVIAYLWLDKPRCAPCGVSARCEPCPPPFVQLSALPKTALIGDEHPGQVLLANVHEPRLRTGTLYRFRGSMKPAPGSGAEPVLHVTDVSAIERQPPVFSRSCQTDGDCAFVARRAIGSAACCPTCGGGAATRAYVDAVETYCEERAPASCPRIAPCRTPAVRCVNRQCNVE